MDLGVTPSGVFQSRATAQVFTALLTLGSMSRVDLARYTGLSPAAVTRAVRPLLDDRYILEMPAEQSRDAAIGRPATSLRVRPDRAAFIGVKITGDEIIAVLTDLCAQTIATRHVPLPACAVDAVVPLVADVVDELRGQLSRRQGKLRALGVSVSGDTDPRAGFVRSSAFLGWRDVPLTYLLQSATGVPTTLDNDVRALAVAEQLFGAGAGVPSFVLVTVGAGIGCGIVVHDRVIAGARGVAGELGHMPVLPGDGPECVCGSRGCLEAIASDHAILRDVRNLTGDERMTLGQCLELAHRGEPAVRAVYARAGQAIGLGIASVANLIGPSRIILSGEGLAAYGLFEDQIRKVFAEHAFGTVADCELIVRPLPFDEWARGAAAIAIQRSVNFGARTSEAG
jgi:predicted NBD/HSP70 family sugar kinase